MLCFSRSLRPTRFLAPSRFRFSHHLSFTALSSRMHQDPNPLPVIVLPSAVYLNQNPYHFQSRFFTRKSFSRRRENAPTSAVKEDEKQKHDTSRLLFVRKVYVIVGAQLLLTLTVSSAVACSDSFLQFVVSNTEEFLLMIGVPMLVSLLLFGFCYEKYPLNVISLGAVTFGLSLMMSPVLSIMQGKIIFESLALTTATVSSFTGFVFWAAKKGYADICYWRPLWRASHILFILADKIGFSATLVWFAIRGLISLAWVVVQNASLLHGFKYNEYTLASSQIYLGIISMFFLFPLVLI